MSIQRGNWVSNILLVIIVVIAGICLINKFTVGIEFNVNGTDKSQLLVHPEGVRLMDFRSSIEVYDKSTPHGTNEGFESQIEMNGWFQDEKLARSEYLNKLMRDDYIQSYPWMASNPGGATSFNNALFNQASQQQIYIRRPQTYYDFGEITYIGNPL
jgi:hypothetical protein